MLPYMVRQGLEQIECAHPPKIIAQLRKLDLENGNEYLVPDIVIVPLHWQLQIDGTYRKIGICKKCGQVYVTDEILQRNSIYIAEEDGDNHV